MEGCHRCSHLVQKLVRLQPLSSAAEIRKNIKHLLPIFRKCSKSSKPRSRLLQSLPLSFWALSVFLVLPFSFSSSYGASKSWLRGPAETGIFPLSPSQLWSWSEPAHDLHSHHNHKLLFLFSTSFWPDFRIKEWIFSAKQQWSLVAIRVNDFYTSVLTFYTISISIICSIDVYIPPG